MRFIVRVDDELLTASPYTVRVLPTSSDCRRRLVKAQPVGLPSMVTAAVGVGVPVEVSVTVAVAVGVKDGVAVAVAVLRAADVAVAVTVGVAVATPVAAAVAATAPGVGRMPPGRAVALAVVAGMPVASGNSSGAVLGVAVRVAGGIGVATRVCVGVGVCESFTAEMAWGIKARIVTIEYMSADTTSAPVAQATNSQVLPRLRLLLRETPGRLRNVGGLIALEPASARSV